MLSIDNDKLSLQKQVMELTEKSREENYVIRGKLSEKDGEIRSMKEELISMRSQMNVYSIQYCHANFFSSAAVYDHQ